MRREGLNMFRSLQLSVLFLFVFGNGCDCVMDEKRLHTDLLASYNINIRPVLNQTGSIAVQFGLAMIDFNLDPATDVLDCSFWIRMKWTDEYLRWSPEEYGGVSITRFGQDDIWKPDIFLYNSWDATSVQQSASMGTYPLVVPSGSVLWVPAVRLRARCTLMRADWPREMAHCYLKFGSWTHHGYSLNLTLYDNSPHLDMSDYIGSQRWTVLNTSSRLVNKRYPCCDEPYPSIEYNITLRRQEHRTAPISMPIVFGAGLMLISFVVPVDHVQKLTLGWVSLLVTLLGLLNMYNQMTDQAHGRATVALFYWSFGMVQLVFFGLQAVVVRLNRATTLCMPKCIRAAMAGLMGRVLCLDSPILHNYSQEDNEMLDQPTMDDGEFNNPQNGSSRVRRRDPQVGSASAEWSLLAGALDRLLAAAFLLVIIVIVPPNITWSN